jgi:hypothetical protein
MIDLGVVFYKFISHTMNKLVLFSFVFGLLCISACVPTGITAGQFTVRVLDAETRAPIIDARVDLYYYPSTPDSPEPNHPYAITDANGVAKLPNKAVMAIWQVQANGYIEQRSTSNNGLLPPQYAAQATSDYNGTINLYKLPEPQLNILLQGNYIGPLTIHLEPASGFNWIKVDTMNTAFVAVDPQASYIQKSAGTRVFTETASADGAVDLVVTPLLYEIQTQQLRIMDQAGLLPYRDIANLSDTDRGVWGTITDDEKNISHQISLFVGSREDYLMFLKNKP